MPITLSVDLKVFPFVRRIKDDSSDVEGREILRGKPRKGSVGAMATTRSTLRTDNGLSGYVMRV